MSENIKILLILVAMLLFMSLFVIDYVDLERFRDCYENNFQSQMCERYKDY